MKWYQLYRELCLGSPYLKFHIVSKDIVEQVADSLLKRNIPDVQYKQLRPMETCLDLGGPMSLDRHLHSFDVDDLIIKIPSTDMRYFYDRIQELEERDDIGASYFKIHSAYSCVCLTENQRETLLIQMSSEIVEAEAFAEIENQYMKEVFSQANKVAAKQQLKEEGKVLDFVEFKRKKGIEA